LTGGVKPEILLVERGTEMTTKTTKDRHEHEWVPCDDDLICDGCGGIR
jgi:hypothetical protein